MPGTRSVKPGRKFDKKKGRRNGKRKNFQSMKVLLDSADYVDAGEIEVVVPLKDIPEGNGIQNFYESATRKFACFPWRLELHRVVDIRGTQHLIKPTLVCDNKGDQVQWMANASGILTMEKWQERGSKTSSRHPHEERKSEYREIFTRKFNDHVREHRFLGKFPLPVRPRAGGVFNALAESAYLKNGQVKFRLEIVVHSVRKAYFPHYDFQKKTPMCNAIVKIKDNHNQYLSFHINKEFLSMHSEPLSAMFNNPNFIEGQSNEIELTHIDPPTFNEFLGLIYPSRKRPNMRFLRGLLDFARCYFMPMITAVCEQRLLDASDAEMPVGERLRLADEFGLFKVKSKIMQSLDCNQLDDKFTDNLSQETLQMLLRKQKLQKEREKAKEAAEAAAAAEKEKQQQKQAERDGAEAMDVEVGQPTVSSSSNRRHGGGGGGGTGHGGHGQRGHGAGAAPAGRQGRGGGAGGANAGRARAQGQGQARR